MASENTKMNVLVQFYIKSALTWLVTSGFNPHYAVGLRGNLSRHNDEMG